MTRCFVLLASAVLGASGWLQGETKQERGQRVVNEALAALGGDRFLAMKDRIESGRAYSFYRDQLTGLSVAKIYTRHLEAPGPNGVALRERQSFGKEEDYYVLFTGDNGYTVTFRGARPMLKDRYTRWVDSTRRNVLYTLRHRLKEPGLLFESQGTLVWQNTPVEVVDIIDGDNAKVTVYFQVSTKLPLRQVFVRRDPVTKERFEEVSVFAKYREVSGVQWPYNITAYRNGGKVYEIFSDSVLINQDLSDNLLTLSSTMKVLPPEK